MKDADGDDYGDANPPSGVSSGTDCDDSDASKYKTWNLYEDSDQDGYGTGGKQEVCGGSTRPTGWSSTDWDCDDSSDRTYPGAAPKDSQSACMKDADGDDYGDSNVSSPIVAGSDCDDDDSKINPEATETCDNVDNNCSGVVDEGCQCDYTGTSTGVCSEGTILPLRTSSLAYRCPSEFV